MMKKRQRIYLLFLLGLLTAVPLQAQKNQKPLGRPCRFTSSPVISEYREALSMEVPWAIGMKKKQLKKVRTGLNPMFYPKGLSNSAEIYANTFNLCRLKMYSIVSFPYGNSNFHILFVPEAENRDMPVELRPTTDIYLCVNAFCVDDSRAYTPDQDGKITRYYSPDEFSPGKYVACRIINPSGILPSGTIYNHQGWREFVKTDLIEDVVVFSKEIDRPDFFMSNVENRITYADRFPFYTCNAIAEFYVDGKKTCLVEINAYENRHMPQEMIPLQTMYLVVNDSALDRTRGWDEELDGNPEPINSKTALEFPEVKEPIAERGLDVIIGKGEQVKCYITDRGELYSEAGIDEFRDQLASWFPNFDEVASNIVQTQWPEGINSLDRREENDHFFIDYNAYALARMESADQVFYIVKISPDDNRHMPADMIPDKTIYFLFGAAGLSLEKMQFVAPVINEIDEHEDPPVIEDTDISPVEWNIAVAPGAKTRVYIVDRGQLYSSLSIQPYRKEIETYIGSLYYEVAKFGIETQWPASISDLSNRESRSTLFKQYAVNAIARFGTKYYILEVLPEENKHMPADMQSDKPFYFIIGGEGISINKP